MQKAESKHVPPDPEVNEPSTGGTKKTVTRKRTTKK